MRVTRPRQGHTQDLSVERHQVRASQHIQSPQNHPVKKDLVAALNSRDPRMPRPGHARNGTGVTTRHSQEFTREGSVEGHQVTRLAMRSVALPPVFAKLSDLPRMRDWDLCTLYTRTSSSSIKSTRPLVPGEAALRVTRVLRVGIKRLCRRDIHTSGPHVGATEMHGSEAQTAQVLVGGMRRIEV